jgi:hypothetical protein
VANLVIMSLKMVVIITAGRRGGQGFLVGAKYILHSLPLSQTQKHYNSHCRSVEDAGETVGGNGADGFALPLRSHCAPSPWRGNCSISSWLFNDAVSRMINECGAVGEMRTGRRNGRTRRKYVPVPRCPEENVTKHAVIPGGLG